jgi:hypothetical protein
MSLNKLMLAEITKNLQKATKFKRPKNQWQDPGEITEVNSRNITMRGVNYPVLGVGADGYTQMMQPEMDYEFPQGPVVEYPMMQPGGQYGDGTAHKISVPLTKEQIKANQIAKLAKEAQKNQASIGTRTGTPTKLRKQLYDERLNAERFQKLLSGADVVTDLMQLGNFIPHPIAQAVGKAGNYLGAGVDAFQAGMETRKGNYDNTAMNAASVVLPNFLASKTFRRNSKYLQPGQPLYPLSPQAGILPGGYTRTNYIEPFIKVRGMTDKNLLANRALLGALTAETMYDSKKQGGEMIRRADGSYSRRGLWDNIRANKGSGKKPTKQMLEQERKIKAQEKQFGGQLLNDLDMYNYYNPMMDYMAKGGEPQNAGFQALPDYVQNKIMANMAYGGYIPEMMHGGFYMQDGGEPDGGMAIGQIQASIDKLMNLRKFIQPDSDLEPWISSKLTLMDHYTDAVNDYMQYNPEAQEGEEYEEDEMMMMAEGGGIPQRYKNMGFNKVGVKKKSTRPGKKWMVLAKKGDQYKVVHGGYKGMQDFTQHRNEGRRKNFWNRMGGKGSSKATDPFSPLYWHKRFGTWEEGGQVDDVFANGGYVPVGAPTPQIPISREYMQKLTDRYNQHYSKVSNIQSPMRPAFSKDDGYDSFWYDEYLPSLKPNIRSASGYLVKDAKDPNEKRFVETEKKYPPNLGKNKDNRFSTEWVENYEIQERPSARLESDIVNALADKSRQMSPFLRGNYRNGGYIGYDGKRHMSNTPTWSGNVGYQTGGSISDEERAFEEQQMRDAEAYNVPASQIRIPVEFQETAAPAAKKAVRNTGSVVDYLASQGQASDYATRAKLAASMGIKNYRGTADQNMALLQTLSGAAPKDIDNAVFDNDEPVWTDKSDMPEIVYKTKRRSIFNNPNVKVYSGPFPEQAELRPSSTQLKGTSSKLDPYGTSLIRRDEPLVDSELQAEFRNQLLLNAEILPQVGLPVGPALRAGAKLALSGLRPAIIAGAIRMSPLVDKAAKVAPKAIRAKAAVNVPKNAVSWADKLTPPLQRSLERVRWGNLSMADKLAAAKKGASAFKKDGGIHINPANKGKFTASAQRAGMGVQEFAQHVMANREDYSPTQVKRANFARNAAKWNKQQGGPVVGDEMDVTPAQLEYLRQMGYEFEMI